MPTFHVHRTKTVLPLLTWLGIFLMPLLVTMLEGQSKPFSWYATNFFLTLSICLMYYLNYFVLVERYLVRQRVKQFVLANFLAASVLSAADYLMVGVWLLGVDDNAQENILMQSTIIFFLVLNVLLPISNYFVRLLFHLAMLPIVAGTSYEVLMGLAHSDSKIAHILRWPGLQMQRLTTREPDLSMLECAIVSINVVLYGLPDFIEKTPEGWGIFHSYHESERFYVPPKKEDMAESEDTEQKENKSA